MRNPALHEKRNQQILADLVRMYIRTGEPVSSRTISHQCAEVWSPATIRNVMADLEDAGYLSQPHTSAGRVPTAAGYRFYVEQVARRGGQATLSPEDQSWIREELAAAATPEEIMERAGHVLATVSRGLGIIVSPPLAKSVVEHIRFVALPDGRVLVVLVSTGGLARDKVIRPERGFAQEELDRISDYLNRHYAGCTLETIRADLAAHLARERERYNRLLSSALVLCDPSLLEEDVVRQVYVEGAAQIATAPEFADQAQLSELLGAIEEKKRLVALLTGCIESPEPVHVEIGLKGFSNAGDRLALISAPYTWHDQAQGSLGILGPMRMQYERAITTVAYLARLFSQVLSGANQP